MRLKDPATKQQVASNLSIGENDWPFSMKNPPSTEAAPSGTTSSKILIVVSRTMLKWHVRAIHKPSNCPKQIQRNTMLPLYSKISIHIICIVTSLCCGMVGLNVPVTHNSIQLYGTQCLGHWCVSALALHIMPFPNLWQLHCSLMLSPSQLF